MLFKKYVLAQRDIITKITVWVKTNYANTVFECKIKQLNINLLNYNLSAFNLLI